MDINFINEMESNLLSLISNQKVVHEAFANQINPEKTQQFDMMYKMVNEPIQKWCKEMVKMLKNKSESVNHAMEQSNNNQQNEEMKQQEMASTIEPITVDDDNLNDDQDESQLDDASIDNQESVQSETSISPRTRRRTSKNVCYKCNRSFSSSQNKDNHNCNDDEQESDSDTESDDSNQSIDFTNSENTNNKEPETQSSDEDVNQNKASKHVKKKKQKRKTNAKNTNKNGSKRADGMTLEEAIKIYKTTNSMKGWSRARVIAWKNRVKNPNSFYYRFNVVGISQNERRQLELTRDSHKGAWKQNEEQLFMKRVLECGVNIEWGTFSQKIPGRVGYTCSNHWKKLMKNGCVIDSNYVQDGNDYVYKWNNKQAKDDKYFMQCRRYGFKVIADTFNIWNSTQQKHPKHPKSINAEVMDLKYSKHHSPNYKKYLQTKPNKKRKRNDDNKHVQSSKRRRIEYYAESNEESEEEDEDNYCYKHCNIQSKDYIGCDATKQNPKCHHWYHIQCANMSHLSPKQLESATWICDICK